jgi:hypothetical protein
VLPDLAYTVVNWHPLAVRHPQIVVEHAAGELAPRSGASSERWWLEQASLVAALVKVRPVEVLGLAERHLTGGLPRRWCRT